MDANFDLDDYSVVVKHRAPPPKPWRWEIYCAGKRNPIERSDVFFPSRENASLAGREAFTRLMARLAKTAARSS
jgi:hypothetical protein